MAHNESSRVKIPALLHLTRLGYEYVSLSSLQALGHDAETNILTEVLFASLKRINPSVEFDAKLVFTELKSMLGYDDLGKAFYDRITTESGIRIIDFANFDNNSFQVCTELQCKNDDDEFRPDITVLINGLPLSFIEVKKPNNHGGIVAESDRMNKVRMPNKKFRRFLNAVQLMVFSNNMEYDAEGGITPIQGAFYATTSANTVELNSFHEEDKTVHKKVKPIVPATEAFILKDTNHISLKHSPEYPLNQEINTPTNRILTSLYSRARLRTLLKYGIAYLKTEKGYEKHIMRYPQFFATLAIERYIDKGEKKGIIWHTQGSGKTALAYYCVDYLTEYFRKKNIVPKFYFVVDRLELVTNAQDAFVARGLAVNIADSREGFKKAFRAQKATTNTESKSEITVVNIQKFDDNTRAVDSDEYDLSVQRIYFLDEAHRSYNPSGSFLSNLKASDRNGIFIALTGTPLLKQNYTDSKGKKAVYNSKAVFGDYIHKYYYDRSIADGYTLRLIREGIETTYKAALSAILDSLEVEAGSLDARKIFAHKKYVEPLTEYIINDLEKSRIRLGDPTIGSMIVCSSSEQARAIHKRITDSYPHIKSALILHDEDDKETRRQSSRAFKYSAAIDILVVYNMLLTGYDAPRLKKLYLNRVVKDHSLLQTLTRVNRPYKSEYRKDNPHRFGYVVDFADIKNEFDKTNEAYFKELQEEIGEEWQQYSSLFKSVEEIEAEIREIKEKLFLYDIENEEKFSREISAIKDKEKLLELRKVLENARTLGNLIKLYDHDSLWDKLDFAKLGRLLNEVNGHIALINQQEALANDDENTNILNLALEDIVFHFRKKSEHELNIGLVDAYKDQMRRTREAMLGCFDQKDPVFVSLKEELKRLLEKKAYEERTPAELENEIKILVSIYDRITEQNRRDNLLKGKYKGDERYARLHKRLLTHPPFPPEWSKRELDINEALMMLKSDTDDKLEHQMELLKHEAFFRRGVTKTVIKCFDAVKLDLDAITAEQIGKLIVGEYITNEGVA